MRKLGRVKVSSPNSTLRLIFPLSYLFICEQQLRTWQGSQETYFENRFKEVKLTVWVSLQANCSFPEEAASSLSYFHPHALPCVQHQNTRILTSSIRSLWLSSMMLGENQRQSSLYKAYFLYIHSLQDCIHAKTRYTLRRQWSTSVFQMQCFLTALSSVDTIKEEAVLSDGKVNYNPNDFPGYAISIGR